MTFKEWLPVTRRNRVALVFASSSFVMFALWNWITIPVGNHSSESRVFGLEIWGTIFDTRSYRGAFTSNDWQGFLVIGGVGALIASSIMAILTVPLWRVFHACPMVMKPLAGIIFSGGFVVLLWSIAVADSFDSISEIAAFTFLSANMFTISAALFLFENELALRKPIAFPT